MVCRSLVLTALVACGPVKGNPPGGDVDAPTGDPGFGVAVLTTNPNVPLDGRAGIELTVTRTGGFEGDVTIAAVTPPNGLQVDPLTIAAGETTGELAVGALTPLAIGDTVTFTVEATAGELTPKQLDFEDAEVTGKPGSLDITWGPAGTGFGSIFMGGDGGSFDAMEVVAGKVIATGSHFPFITTSMATARFTATGLVDTTFDSNPDPNINENLVENGFGSSSSENTFAVAVGHQNDGRIILIGRTSGKDSNNLPVNGVGLVQLSATGLVGSQIFGNLTGSKSRFDLDPTAGAFEETADGLVLPDNRIVFVGTVAGKQFVGMTDSTGILDPNTFAGAGFVIESLGGTTSTGNEIATDSSNRLVVLGSTSTADKTDLVVSRYTATGALDTFGTAGRLTITSGGVLTPVGLEVLSSGKILVAATSVDSVPATHYLLFRLNGDGSPDTTFGTDGVSDHVVATNAIAMTVLGDGKIMVLGQTGNSASLVRFKANGAIDNLFGTGGLVEVPFVDGADIDSIAVYEAHKIVIGATDGQAQPGPGRTALVARLWE